MSVKDSIPRVPFMTWFRKIYNTLKRSNTQINNIAHIAIDEYIDKHLFNNPKYDVPKRLNRFGFQVYSQNEEDGIIQEIFNRIGITNHHFVEFGVGNGLENNTVYLLTKGWRGLWIESDSKSVKGIKKVFDRLLRRENLIINKSFVTCENIESLLIDAGVPEEFDLLSIDIDGNDYWIWKAINRYRPSVVVIEYNSLYPPDQKWVRRYDPHAVWKEDSYFGASLKSLTILGEEKGYRLVACNFTGTNAFFVREDLVQDRFFAPYTAENHYEPPRYFLVRTIGYKRGFGEFEEI